MQGGGGGGGEKGCTFARNLAIILKVWLRIGGGHCINDNSRSTLSNVRKPSTGLWRDVLPHRVRSILGHQGGVECMVITL